MSGEAASTVFVGSISPGVSDRWLVQLFQACGGYRSFKRVSKAFGFADFSTLRDALRVLAVLHDLELPCMGTHRHEPRKKLIVRADEKTSAFLGEFEKTMVRTEADAMQDAAARARVDYVIRAMSNPNAEAGDEPERYEIPSHLKDLSMSEIPAYRRKQVLSEIEKFRLGAVASDAASRRRELELERQRAAVLQARSSPLAGKESTPDTPGASMDTSDVADDPEQADEAAERERQRAEEARRDMDARHAEQAYVEREKARIAAWTERAPADHDPSRRTMEAWISLDEDQELAEELFWTDRRRWTQLRAEARRREDEADRADREAEAAEQSDSMRQADAFLASLAPMARGSSAWRPSGGGAPIKLHVQHGDVSPGVQRRLQLEEKIRADPSKRAELVDALPRDELWHTTPAWTRIDLADVAPIIDRGIEESFGEPVPDLLEAVLDKLRERASAQDVVDVLAPVLDEDEAPALVERVWRFLVAT